MARRGLFLATAAAVAILAVAAVAGEEPASQPAPAARPAPAPFVAAGQKGFDEPVPPIGTFGAVALLLTLLVTAYFIAGIFQCGYDWKPLIAGLFALGMGVLGAAVAILKGCYTMDESILGRPFNGEDTLSQALGILLCTVGEAVWPFVIGLVVVMVGGLFTAILRWRTNRRAKDTGSGATPSA